MSKSLTTPQDAALDQPVGQREAWRLLRADQSNARDITPDRWRLLAVAFRSIPDDVLTTAVLMHMKESPYFPRVSDVSRQLERLTKKTPFQVFCEQMTRLGYRLVDDTGTRAMFANGVTQAVVYR